MQVLPDEPLLLSPPFASFTRFGSAGLVTGRYARTSGNRQDFALEKTSSFEGHRHFFWFRHALPPPLWRPPIVMVTPPLKRGREHSGCILLAPIILYKRLQTGTYPALPRPLKQASLVIGVAGQRARNDVSASHQFLPYQHSYHHQIFVKNNFCRAQEFVKDRMKIPGRIHRNAVYERRY